MYSNVKAVKQEIDQAGLNLDQLRDLGLKLAEQAGFALGQRQDAADMITSAMEQDWVQRNEQGIQVNVAGLPAGCRVQVQVTTEANVQKVPVRLSSARTATIQLAPGDVVFTCIIRHPELNLYVVSMHELTVPQSAVQPVFTPDATELPPPSGVEVSTEVPAAVEPAATVEPAVEETPPSEPEAPIIVGPSHIGGEPLPPFTGNEEPPSGSTNALRAAQAAATKAEPPVAEPALAAAMATAPREEIPAWKE